MSKYSVQEDLEYDKAFESILKDILEIFFSIINKTYIKAIILTGGFGRGEGGIFKDGDNYFFVNDIDLIVIPKRNKRKIKRQIPLVIEAISQKKILEKNSLKQIDFSICSNLLLKFAPNLISYYEIREGSKIIYGNYDLKKIIRRIIPNNLPLYDGTRFFYNRGYGLLIAFYILMKKLDKEITFKHNIVIEMQKASIAIGDTLLLVNGKYHYSYLQRKENFNELIKHKEFILKDKFDIEIYGKLYSLAIERKINPTKMIFEKINYDKIFEIRDSFLNFFKEFESYRLKKSFNSWIDYSIYILKFDINDPFYLKLKRKINEIKLVKNGVELKRKIAVLPHFLLAFNTDFEFDYNYFENVIRQLNDYKLSLIIEKYNKNVVKYFLQIYHPEGIIESIMRYENKKEKR